jgi:hypothetical protein
MVYLVPDFIEGLLKVSTMELYALGSLYDIRIVPSLALMVMNWPDEPEPP